MFNQNSYTEKYKNGYGVQYPEGHVVRFHKHILDYECKKTKGRLFDFGCGNGTHLKYFADHGFTPFGVDTNEIAIDECKKVLSGFESNIKVIPSSKPDLFGEFRGGFDVIISNQVLYYLKNDEIDFVLDQFDRMLNKGGIVMFSMMSTTNSYFGHVTEKNGEMSTVVLSGRLNERTQINFKTRDEVMCQFARFRKLQLGFYTSTIREEEGNSDHYMYVGIKD